MSWKRGIRGGRAGVAGRGGVTMRAEPHGARWRLGPLRGVTACDASAALRLFAIVRCGADSIRFGDGMRRDGMGADCVW